MIYPDLQISALQQEVHKKALEFDISSRRLADAVKDELRPIQFLLNNKKLIWTFFITVLPLTRMIRGVFSFSKPKSKKKVLWKLLTAGWVLKALKLVGPKVSRSVGKSVLNAGLNFFDQILKKSHR